MNSIVFVLGFLGFGAKAGIIPLHIWLPRAHPAAPSHASALMSGVMIKIGVFGIVKVGVDLLGANGGVLWWGLLVLFFGALSSVLGVVYALAEHDIKRLLAYSQRREHRHHPARRRRRHDRHRRWAIPLLAVLGLMAGFYHLVNHAVFKGLLFLGAGSVIYRLHTKDMEKMGGLSPHHAVDRAVLPDRRPGDRRDPAAERLRLRMVHLPVAVRRRAERCTGPGPARRADRRRDAGARPARWP